LVLPQHLDGPADTWSSCILTLKHSVLHLTWEVRRNDSYFYQLDILKFHRTSLESHWSYRCTKYILYLCRQPTSSFQPNYVFPPSTSCPACCAATGQRCSALPGQWGNFVVAEVLKDLCNDLCCAHKSCYFVLSLGHNISDIFPAGWNRRTWEKGLISTYSSSTALSFLRQEHQMTEHSTVCHEGLFLLFQYL
jgi:hypothetical protein